jgi:hypothetical protein
MEQASKHISAFVSTVSVSQNCQDKQRHTITMTLRQKVADPSDKRRSDMQLIGEEIYYKHNVYSGRLSRDFLLRSTRIAHSLDIAVLSENHHVF